MRCQENVKNTQHSKVGCVNLGARNAPKASRKCQDYGIVLLVCPGFIEKERIYPNKQKKHQDLVLKGVQLQKRRSADDACQWRVRYDLFDPSSRFFLHAYHLFDC
jgi:hypothetical protein